MRTKNFLKLLACVLALSLLVAFVINASNIAKPLKRLTQKKVPNPKNVLNRGDINWHKNITRNGITFCRNEDGSWHIFGTSTAAFDESLIMQNFSLENGETYFVSSGMKHDGLSSYSLRVVSSDGKSYVGNLTPDGSEIVEYGAFEATSSVTYNIIFRISHTGAVIDEVLYPCLIEGTEPGDFYTYK